MKNFIKVDLSRNPTIRIHTVKTNLNGKRISHQPQNKIKRISRIPETTTIIFDSPDRVENSSVRHELSHLHCLKRFIEQRYVTGPGSPYDAKSGKFEWPDPRRQPPVEKALLRRAGCGIQITRHGGSTTHRTLMVFAGARKRYFLIGNCNLN